MIKRIEANKQVVVRVYLQVGCYALTYLCNYDKEFNFLKDALERATIDSGATNKPIWIEYFTGDSIGEHCFIVKNDYSLEFTTKTYMEYIGLA